MVGARQAVVRRVAQALQSSEWRGVQLSLEIGEEKWAAWLRAHPRCLCMKP